MNIRNYILESFGGVMYVWKRKMKLAREAEAKMEGDSFHTRLDRVSAITKPEFTYIVPELVGQDFWFVNFTSPTGFTFGVDDKSKKAVQMLINQLKEVIRDTKPDGFIFKMDLQREWTLKRLFDWILIPTMKNVLGYKLYSRKQISHKMYMVFKKG